MNSLSFPAVQWIIGLPSAGKSTLATALRRRVTQAGLPSLLLDGDDLRGGLCRGLGFSDVDRTESLRRAAEVAALAARAGIGTVAAMITPLRSQREMIAEVLAGHRLLWVWADCPMDECRRRDVKGLYRRQWEGAVTNLTGADGVFEAPGPEALRLDTAKSSVEQCVERIWTSMDEAKEARRPDGLSEQVREDC